jgi:hypothetical protein
LIKYRPTTESRDYFIVGFIVLAEGRKDGFFVDFEKESH